MTPCEKRTTRSSSISTARDLILASQVSQTFAKEDHHRSAACANCSGKKTPLIQRGTKRSTFPKHRVPRRTSPKKIGCLRSRTAKISRRVNYFALGKGNWRCSREILSSPLPFIIGGLEVLLICLEDIVVANPDVVDSLIL
jgi:hypothetical protein